MSDLGMKLQGFGASLQGKGTEFAAAQQDQQYKQLQQALIMSQLNSAQADIQRRNQVGALLAKYPNASPQELAPLLAAINPDKFADDALKYAGTAITTSPQGGLAGYQAAPQQQGALAGMNAPSAPSGPQPLYKGGQLIKAPSGAEGYVLARNPDGSQTEIPVPGGQADKAKEKLESLLAEQLGKFKELRESGGIRDENKDMVSSLGDAAQSSWLGQKVGGALGTKNQRIRKDIKSAQQLVKQALMSATGMSSKQIDSNQEAQNFLEAIADPSNYYQNAENTISRISELFGTGQTASQIKTPNGGAKQGGRRVIKFGDLGK